MMDTVCDLCESENCIVTDGDHDWQQWECLDCGNVWREYDDSDETIGDFRQAWKEIQNGETLPISELWNGIDNKEGGGDE